MDAIELIHEDHQEIERLFERYERAEGDGDRSEQRTAVRGLVRELSVHAAIEEQLLYPALRRAGGEDQVLEALEQHHLVKVTLAELEDMNPAEERFSAKMRLLSETVRGHIEEEEREILPRLHGALDAAQLRELGDSLARARSAAPTRPHPSAPDTPPGNLVAGPAAAFIDRGRDALRGGFEMLQSVAERGLERARGAVVRVERTGQRMAGRAGERGRQVAGELRERGREVAGELRERGHEAAGELRERGHEAAGAVRERGREAINGASERGRRAVGEVRRRGREAAKRTQASARRTGTQARKSGRAAARGTREGEARRPAAREPGEEPTPTVH